MKVWVLIQRIRALNKNKRVYKRINLDRML